MSIKQPLTFLILQKHFTILEPYIYKLFKHMLPSLQVPKQLNFTHAKILKI